MVDGKKVVFVGIPMAGKSDDEIRNELDETAQMYLSARFMNESEVIFLNNYDYTDREPPDWVINKSIWYLHRALKLLSKCDEAVFGKGWQFARGCVIEQQVCSLYGISTCLKREDCV